ncbi:MAG: hypothetical protein MUC65_06785, partial [Pontiellaceae bacterium]|nr:hypothetical protein [Pontiellaceae bacterium]
NLLGTFDTVHAQQFPVIHPYCAVALRVRFDRIEEGNHPVRIAVVDQDGKLTGINMEGGVAVRFSDNLMSVCANMVLNISGMKFEKPGQYAINLAIDNRHEKSLPLTVVQAEPAPQQY